MFSKVNRENTHAIKWEKYKHQSLFPMWVADMDLASPEPIQNALVERMNHPVYGYAHPWASLNESVVNWCAKQYNWSIDPEWIVWMPGVVPSFNLACEVYGKKGRVIVQTPNYPPMLQAAKLQGCESVELPVTWQNAQWQWDWQTLETELSHPDCHLFLLCNPMNPHGAVLSAEDIHKLAQLCQQYEVVLCSDEIHCDLILDGTLHVPVSSIKAIKDQSVTLMAASKTFNVAGFGCSFAIIPNASMRRAWQARANGIMPDPNFAGMLAAEVAFTECHDWHKALLTHLKNNQKRVADVINNLEGLSFKPQAATFLAWIESTDLKTPLAPHFIKAGVMPSEGVFFGNPLNVRLNFGTDVESLDHGLAMISSYWQQKA
ncbi:PatB family C-S lyase [Reinekea marina]|uniref:cysteine-S-conjugate beta-lyase n=1 Tax=Reinekea marina TaxID=1310421 RepID=A0ABV7WSN1_9GAMM|nr:PatB family C-S lyase [Reinekea marina]MDN3649203.1 PatB family C-S lyase [Reinekea marina]